MVVEGESFPMRCSVSRMCCGAKVPKNYAQGFRTTGAGPRSAYPRRWIHLLLVLSGILLICSAADAVSGRPGPNHHPAFIGCAGLTGRSLLASQLSRPPINLDRLSAGNQRHVHRSLTLVRQTADNSGPQGSGQVGKAAIPLPLPATPPPPPSALEGAERAAFPVVRLLQPTPRRRQVAFEPVERH